MRDPWAFKFQTCGAVRTEKFRLDGAKKEEKEWYILSSNNCHCYFENGLFLIMGFESAVRFSRCQTLS
jgi:hypothetical protein